MGCFYMGSGHISMTNLSCVILGYCNFQDFSLPRRFAKTCRKIPIHWCTLRIFFIFSARGRGRGSEAPARGWARSVSFIENPRRGGSPRREEEGGAGREGVCGEFGGGGGWDFFFFRGRDAHQD